MSNAPPASERQDNIRVRALVLQVALQTYSQRRNATCAFFSRHFCHLLDSSNLCLCRSGSTVREVISMSAIRLYLIHEKPALGGHYECGFLSGGSNHGSNTLGRNGTVRDGIRRSAATSPTAGRRCDSCPTCPLNPEFIEPAALRAPAHFLCSDPT
jgi:hypothetical protein